MSDRFLVNLLCEKFDSSRGQQNIKSTLVQQNDGQDDQDYYDCSDYPPKFAGWKRFACHIFCNLNFMFLLNLQMYEIVDFNPKIR